MDHTIIPRYLIYKERKNISDFENDEIGNLNRNLYRLLRRYIYAEMGMTRYSNIIKELMNEAYYLCTLFLMDDNSEIHFREYVETILKENRYSEDITHRFRKMVFALTYAYLEKIALNSHNIRTIRRHLRSYSFEYMALCSETAELKHPVSSMFQPIVLTDEIMEKVNWSEVTQGFDFNYVGFFLEVLGRNPEEKRTLVRAIYLSFLNYDNLSQIPYKVDNLLISCYESYGGRRQELLNLGQRSIEKDTKAELLERISRLEEEKMKYLKKLEQVETRNKLLMQELNVAQKQLNNLSSERMLTQRDKEEIKRREEELKVRLAEMDKKVRTFQDKLGTKSVKLSSLVEGLKRYTRFRGIDAGKDVFLSLNYLLLKEAVWVENVEDLENFFVEYETENKSPLLQLENNNGGIIQISKKDKE